MRRLVRAVGAGVVALALCACGGPKRPPAGPQAAAAPAQETDLIAPIRSREYKIQVGDQLGVKFFYNPELNEELTVRPDGRISLQLIPEIVAAGHTPASLSELLRALYSPQLDKPEIAVIVRSFSAERVYVDGEVRRPGELALVHPATVLQAIARAGGLTDRARANEILLIRRGPTGEAVVTHLNLKRARRGRDPGQDPGLMPYDIVYVPRTAISNVNRWVERYVRLNIPVSFGFRVDVE
jgi:protein involved in polysaccharide export with SLBB domain